MSTIIEAPVFNLDQTVQKWNERVMHGGPFSIDEVLDLARDSVYLAAHLNGVRIESLEDGEEVTWQGAGFIGMDTQGELWISMNYHQASLRTVLEHDADAITVTDFVWRGLLLKHRAHPDLIPHRDSIHEVLGPDVVW